MYLRHFCMGCILILLFTFVAWRAEATLPLDFSEGLVVIPVEVNGQPLRALLDTGANVNAIDISLEKLGKPSSRTKTLNFSDHFGGKAKVIEAPILIDGRTQVFDFAVTKTRISKSCCDLILGKPFFDKNVTLFDFSSSQLSFNPTKLPLGKKHEFSLPRTAKEILLSCQVNGHSTKARIDLGSQQATDLTGQFVESLKIMDNPTTIFLDSMLQPGIGLARIEAKCGSWKLESEIPALLHARSSTALGSGEAGLNIGLPWIRRFSVLMDLPHSKVVFFERSSMPPVSFNSLYTLFSNEPGRGVVAKSVLAGGAGEDLGLRIDDKILKINGEDANSAEKAYQIIESRPLGVLSIQIVRQQKNLTLSGKIDTLFPRKVLFPQSFYGWTQASSMTPNQRPNIPLDIGKTKSLRLILYEIAADFSVSRKLEGMQVRDLLLRPLESKINSDESALYFEGLRLTANRSVSIDLSRSAPSISLGCGTQKMEAELTWINSQIADFTQRMDGCGRHLKIKGSFYFSEDVTTPAGPSNEEPFFFLTDPQTGKTAHWDRRQITLALDKRAPEWVEKIIAEVIGQYNEVLSPKLSLKVERMDLQSIPISSPDYLGIYWTQDGHSFDRETRFAITRLVQNPKNGGIIDADILLREPEFIQHEKLVSAIANEATLRNPDAKDKLNDFVRDKIHRLRTNVLFHEVGHLLGLSHNFSQKEKSVMSYDTIDSLSEYDRASLKYLYKNEKPPRTFDLQSRPPSSLGGYD